jgi:peptidoglycan/xylan/chitin deacetylase (PgdA/CDA1 family)
MLKKAIGLLLIIGALGYGVAPTVKYRWRHLYQKSERADTLYLTFDDGPSATYTGLLLDLLRRYQIKASFFVVASFAAAHPVLIKRMQAEGHLIGLHSLEHKNALYLGPTNTRADFKYSMDIMRRLGIKVQYYRPPWGDLNLVTVAQMQKYSLTPVFWDVMVQDWRGNTTAEVIADKLRRRTQGGDIICLHDGRGKNGAPLRTICALEQMLPLWLQQGFKFQTVDHYGK